MELTKDVAVNMAMFGKDFQSNNSDKSKSNEEGYGDRKIGFIQDQSTHSMPSRQSNLVTKNYSVVSRTLFRNEGPQAKIRHHRAVVWPDPLLPPMPFVLRSVFVCSFLSAHPLRVTIVL